MAAISDVVTATDSVSARSANSWPSSPSMNRMGRKMAILVIVDANNAPTTCDGPSRAALARRHAGLTQPHDVLLHDDRRIQHETDCERETCERDDIKTAAQHAESTSSDESSENGIVSCDHQRGAPAAQEPATARRVPGTRRESRLPFTSAIARRICTDASKLSTICRSASASGPALSSSSVAVQVVEDRATVLAPYLPCT